MSTAERDPITTRTDRGDAPVKQVGGARSTAPWAALAEIRRHGPLLRNMVRREIRQRYKGSLLGFGWNLVIPAVMVATYTFVFRYIFRSEVPDYVVYLACGLGVWMLFTGSAQSAASSLVVNANLVKKVSFPREIVPIAAMAAGAVAAGALIAISLALCLIFRPVGLPLLMLPVFLVLTGIFTIGVGLLLAALNVYLRDVEYLFGALTMPWFFLTPILFAFADLPPNLEANRTVLRLLHYANPMTPFVFGTQDAMFYSRWPQVVDIVYATVAALVSLVVGLYVFRRLERNMAVEL